MKNSKNYYFFLLGILTSSSAWGATESTRVSSLESRMAAIKNDSVKNTTGAKLASAAPQIDGFGFFATADFLCWQAKEGGNDYALSMQNPSFLPTSGKAQHTRFDWDFGFRTGIGYHMEHDAWDGYLNFTWFQTSASNSANQPGALSPQKGFALPEVANQIKAHWNLHYYVLDLELGRDFFVSKYLSFRPQFGIESAWINQHRRYDITTDIDPATGIFGQINRGKNNFFGIGPRAGIQGTWYFCPHVNLLGFVNGSLQWGRFHNDLHETALTTAADVEWVDISTHQSRMVPNAQMGLSIGWDSNLCDDQFHLGVHLGYEFQYWWRQNQFLNEQLSNLTNFEHESMDLSFNGATLNIRFDF